MRRWGVLVAGLAFLRTLLAGDLEPGPAWASVSPRSQRLPLYCTRRARLVDRAQGRDGEGFNAGADPEHRAQRMTNLRLPPALARARGRGRRARPVAPQRNRVPGALPPAKPRAVLLSPALPPGRRGAPRLDRRRSRLRARPRPGRPQARPNPGRARPREPGHRARAAAPHWVDHALREEDRAPGRLDVHAGARAVEH